MHTAVRACVHTQAFLLCVYVLSMHMPRHKEARVRIAGAGVCMTLCTRISVGGCVPRSGGRCMPMHGTKACVRGSVRWGLRLHRSCRCTVQGHRRLVRVQAMCVHSCVSWLQASGCPARPLLLLSVLLCFFTVGGCLGSQLSGLGISAPPWLARREARLPLGWAEPDRLPLPAQGGRGGGGAPGHPSSVITA